MTTSEGTCAHPITDHGRPTDAPGASRGAKSAAGRNG